MGEVKGKVRRVTRIVADHTTTHSLGERYGEFCEQKVEIADVSEFYMDCHAET